MTARTNKPIRWSPQQADFLKFAQEEDGSCVLEAVAGAGKTTTILEAACTMRGGVAILAFNKKIADEIKGKLAERGVNFRKAEAGTVHSFGFRAFRKTFEHVRLDEEKVPGMVDLALPPEWDHLRSGIVTLIGLAKQAAIGVLTAIDSLPAWMHLADHHDVFGDVDQDEDFDLAAIVAFCIRMLRENNRETGRIDFDDMVYLPLVHRVRFWRYDVVMIDEAQDTNGARRALVRALVRPGGRVIAVGDRCQPLGTMVSVPAVSSRWHKAEPKAVPIESLSVGDRVVSYEPSDCAMVMAGRTVNGITRRPFDGHLIVVTDSEGRTSRYTPEHRVYVNAEPLRSKVAVYLMRKGEQFRIGKARLDYQGATGISARMRAEGADGVWILSLHDTDDEAFFQEQAVAGKFGLPQLMFSPKNMMRGPAVEYLPRAWAFIGENVERAEMCLAHFRLDPRFPLFSSTDGYATLKRPIVTRAVNMIEGMLVLPFTGSVHPRRADWRPVTISRERYSGDVVSLDVGGSHLYVADGLVTHNCQAIYGFSGADADALDQIARDFSARRMPLTVTYRCPKAIVEFARQWVSHIEAHESAPQGEVMNLTAEQFVREHVQAGKLDARSAILCRNTKPLVALAFRLIAAGVACRVEGREIGAGLKKLASRWKRVRSTAALRERLEAFLEREMTKLLAAGKEARAQEVDDKVQTLIAIIEYCETRGQTTLKDVEARIDELFEDKVTGLLVLSTIHKSKGREWPTVYWLDRKGTCPSPYARKDWQIGQEANLCYVAATRAQERLIEIPAIKTLALPEKAAEPAAKAAA